jgi:hypothetical protein
MSSTPIDEVICQTDKDYGTVREFIGARSQIFRRLMTTQELVRLSTLAFCNGAQN